MKKILFLFIILAITACAQTVQNVYVVRGDAKQLVFSHSGNIASTAITFIAKTGPNFIDPRIIQKKNTAAGGDDTQITAVYNAPYTTIRVFIDPEDTEDLSGYSFYYDITSASTTVFRGDFKLWYDVSTPYDGTMLPGSGVRITTVALENGENDGDIPIWDEGLGRYIPGPNIAGDTTGGSSSVPDGNVTGDLLSWDGTMDPGSWGPITDNTVKKTGNESIAGIKTFTGSYSILRSIYPQADNTGLIGVPGARWGSGSFNNLNTLRLVIPNSTGIDSTEITFSTDGGVKFNSDINVEGIYIRNEFNTDSAKMSMDSDGNIKMERSVIIPDTSALISTITFFDAGETPNDITDSSLVIDYANSIRFLMPGANMSNLENITFSSLPAGSLTQIVYFSINSAMNYTVRFQDKDGANSSDGNLQLDGDFTLGVGDVLVLQYFGDLNEWYEVSRTPGNAVASNGGDADSLGGVPASDYVNISGTETITGSKNFSGGVTLSSNMLPNTAYARNLGSSLLPLGGIYTGEIILRDSYSPYRVLLTTIPDIRQQRAVTFPDRSGTVAVTVDYQFPDSDGVAGQIQRTDGNGNLTWVTPSYTGGIGNSDSLGSVPAANYMLKSDTLSLSDRINLKAPSLSPTFSGTVNLPTSIVIGGTTLLPSIAELNYVDGLTSSAQAQLNNRILYNFESSYIVIDDPTGSMTIPVSVSGVLGQTMLESLPVSNATQDSLNLKQSVMGSNDNYVTDAEKTVIGNTSGTNTGDNATNSQYSGLATSKFNTSSAQILVDSVYRSNDTIYFHQVDGTTLYFVDQNTGGTGDTSSYTLSQIDSLLTLAGTAIQSSNMNSLAEFDTQIGITGTPSSSTYWRGDNSWATVTAGASALDDLTDVVITAPSNSQALTYNGSNWVNSTLSGSVTAGQITQLNMMWTYLALDTTGIAGTFLEATDAPVSTLTASNVIDVSANDVIRIATDSGSYRVYSNGGWTSWTSTAGYYKDVDSVQVRHVSSASNSTATDQTLWVSNDSETFTINTVSAGGSFQMETQRFIDDLITPLASGTETAIDSFVVMLKDTFGLDSLSQMFNAIYLSAIETEEAGLKNLVKRSHDATESGTDLVWTANEGWNGVANEGTSVGYLNLNYNPATDSAGVVGNLSIGITAYVRICTLTDLFGDAGPIVGTNDGDGNQIQLSVRRNDDGVLYKLNDDTFNSALSNATDNVGVYTLTRTNATRTLYKNGASFLGETVAPTALPNEVLYSLRNNINGTASGGTSAKQVSILMIHRGLTSGEATSLKNILEWWMDRWGKGVL